jgi:ribosomal protein S18 acetylase RimI-like enzyme
MSQLFMRRPNLDALPNIPLPPGAVLREYRESDRDSLAALMRAAFSDETWTPERVDSALVKPADVVKTFVIEQEGEIVATASARLLPETYPGSGYVHWVAAHPSRAGQKLGAIVTVAVLQEFVRRGCKDAVLETDDHRLAAVKTYQNLGFQPEHRHETHPERWARVISDLLAAANI